MLCTADLDKLSDNHSEAGVSAKRGARTAGGTGCNVEPCKVHTFAVIKSRSVANADVLESSHNSCVSNGLAPEL